LSKDRCGAKHFAHVRVNAIETKLHDSLHGEGQVASAFGSTSNEFFQEQSVAVGAPHEVCPGSSIHAGKCGSNEPIGR
jgi:hypothetical protein